ncbi:MAG: aldehyde ferredoxin oxidoreductase C-terminal domain-containing protein [Nitrososphaeria archaeon]|jgi:aldehyde:ferredoxin oxidoreductase
MKGYAGKYAEVDLSSGKIKDVKFDDKTLRTYIGGRGLSVKILWDRLGDKWDEVDPLGPENVLLILTGPLTGYYPGGRICISGKSPQSNGIVGSTMAGEFAIDLRCAGWDGLIVTGVAEKPSYILVKDSTIEVRDASYVWGKDGKKTSLTLSRDVRDEWNKKYTEREWREPSMVYIGPAGENRCRIAGVQGKWAHGAGYGGYGSVMGSKKLKAVLARGTGPLPAVDDMDRTIKLIEECRKACYTNDSFRRWGTGNLGYAVGNDSSSEPVRNWQEEWHDEKSIGVEQYESRVWVKRFWADFGCPTACEKLSVVRVGEFKGAVTDNPDYETQAYFGPNLGVFTPEANVYLNSMIEDLGFCGIQGGNVMGFAGELYQRGILTKEDLDGIELKWGDAKAFAKLAEMIAFRKGIGNTLAEGTYRAAQKLGKTKGKDLLKYAIQSKGVSCGAHGIRSGLDFVQPVSYACSVQGGDHTSVAYIPITHGSSEHTTLISDSGVFCMFNQFKVTPQFQIDFINAVTGFGISFDEWYNDIAKRILQIQRAAVLVGGPDASWAGVDENPSRFYEPLPSGPYKGKSTNRDEVEKMINEYYQIMGWDSKGIPTSETLKQLGLDNVDKILKEKLKA